MLLQPCFTGSVTDSYVGFFYNFTNVLQGLWVFYLNTLHFIVEELFGAIRMLLRGNSFLSIFSEEFLTYTRERNLVFGQGQDWLSEFGDSSGVIV